MAVPCHSCGRDGRYSTPARGRFRLLASDLWHGACGHSARGQSPKLETRSSFRVCRPSHTTHARCRSAWGLCCRLLGFRTRGGEETAHDCQLEVLSHFFFRRSLGPGARASMAVTQFPRRRDAHEPNPVDGRRREQAYTTYTRYTASYTLGGSILMAQSRCASKQRAAWEGWRSW